MNVKTPALSQAPCAIGLFRPKILQTPAPVKLGGHTHSFAKRLSAEGGHKVRVRAASDEVDNEKNDIAKIIARIEELEKKFASSLSKTEAEKVGKVNPANEVNWTYLITTLGTSLGLSFQITGTSRDSIGRYIELKDSTAKGMVELINSINKDMAEYKDSIAKGMVELKDSINKDMAEYKDSTAKGMVELKDFTYKSISELKDLINKDIRVLISKEVTELKLENQRLSNKIDRNTEMLQQRMDRNTEMLQQRIDRNTEMLQKSIDRNTDRVEVLEQKLNRKLIIGNIHLPLENFPPNLLENQKPIS